MPPSPGDGVLSRVQGLAKEQLGHSNRAEPGEGSEFLRAIDQPGLDGDRFGIGEASPLHGANPRVQPMLLPDTAQTLGVSSAP